MHLQLALDPIWKAYEACEPGADAKSILGKVVKGLSLQHVSIWQLVTNLPEISCRYTGHVPQAITSVGAFWCVS